ncbi:MAG: endopeptidase La [Thermoflavifilum sp.]|nr:endopeptidase La [Thermoflavifilum sp.]
MNRFYVDNPDEEMEYMPLFPLNEDSNTEQDVQDLEEELPLLPLRNTVLFPGVVLPITVGRDKSIKAVQEAYRHNRLIGAVAQVDPSIEDPGPQDLAQVGTIARIVKLIRMPDGGTTIIIQGRLRFRIREISSEDPFFKAKYALLHDVQPDQEKEFEAYISTIKDLASQLIQLSPNIPSEATIILRNIEHPSFLIHFVASNLNSEIKEKQQLLEIDQLKARAEMLIKLLQTELQLAELKNKITSRTKADIDRQQREYFLQQQLKSIKEELGGDANEKELKEMQKRASEKKWTDAARELFQKEIEKLERMHPSTPDYSVIYNHLDFMLDLPWQEYTEDHYDLKKARKILDEDHYDMDKIKERILEYLAVLKLKGDMKSPILCFVGPPGIGKTSLGKSIARAIGRKYVRLSLGGLHDESEIRGHRKTYIGAMPGRILQSIRKAKSSNPVMILDEIDKVGSDFRGDPSSALLEVLDPEQNHSFYDNYLELEYDLSRVMFIATANDISTIHPALRDRLEIIELSGYSLEEKIEIARRHLIPKQQEAHGLKNESIHLSPKTIAHIIQHYTRESGVRELDRQLASLMRFLAKEKVLHGQLPKTIDLPMVEKVLGKPRFTNENYHADNPPGVAVGLAWTPVGGEILFIEVSLSEGKGELKITGNLGNIMKESAMTALSYLQSHASTYQIDAQLFHQKNVHIHVPEGAVPKDGPSAGIAILTALASAFTGRKVKPYLAMTGEITLRGELLPVGGIKEKILAAKRAGIKRVILSQQNRKDVEEIDARYLKGLQIIYVQKMEEALQLSLETPRPSRKKRPKTLSLHGSPEMTK